MKAKVGSREQVIAWLASPEPAVFQAQDLRPYGSQIATKPLTDCSFLGCTMDAVLAQAAAAAGCLVLPALGALPFDPFTPGLYTPGELYDKFDPADPVGTYHQCLDWRVYTSVVDPATRVPLPVDVEVYLMRRLHDASVAEALAEVLDLPTRLRTVAIMGGHDVPRDQPVFGQVALLAQHLSQEGFLVLTGGGPGLMEAANLGAYTAGFADPAGVLQQALTALKVTPSGSDPVAWLRAAYLAWQAMGAPTTPSLSRNVGIPTWFYGHEPPNVFATDIGKYFENSVREEGLLAVALAGVIFAEGNAGTVQEIFQDACQNYYRTYDGKKSPMVLFGSDYWASPDMVRHNPRDKRKRVYPLLEKLASERGFSEYLMVTDDVATIIPFLKAHPPALV